MESNFLVVVANFNSRTDAFEYINLLVDIVGNPESTISVRTGGIVKYTHFKGYYRNRPKLDIE
jgi:hypothetical protein